MHATDRDPTCPVARMDPPAREFLAACHAEAHHRSVKADQPPVPCLHCGRDYPWHVLAGVYWRVYEIRLGYHAAGERL